MKTKLLLAIASFVLVFTACQRTDFDDIRRRQEEQSKTITALQVSIAGINSNITSLQNLVAALQRNVTISSYVPTTTGYRLSMSDGTVIELKNGTNGTNGTNGKDGINAPQIGTKLDADGKYYWTLDGNYIIQNSLKLPVTGKDGTNGTNGVTPKLRVNTANFWEISYDNGTSWALVLDADNKSIPATGAQGPAGTPGTPGSPGAAGPQGPAGAAGTGNLAITENATDVIISFNGNIYTIPKTGSTTTPPAASDYKMYLETSIPAGNTITLFLDAALADRADVWIDLNLNNTRDANETVTKFGDDASYTVNSQTIALHGKISRLMCNNQQITALDLSKNTALTQLDCNKNQLSSLDVSTNTALTWLDCSANQLSSLDVSKNTALTWLDCYENKLSSLDVSKNTALNWLRCHNNQLSSLDVSNNTALTYLICERNKLSSLDVSNNTALAQLFCHNNQIKAAAMTALITGLPPKTGNAIVFDERAALPDEGNAMPTASDIAIAKQNGRNWTLNRVSSTGAVIEL